MKNKFKVFALVCVLLLTSGCGTSNYIKDDEGNIVEFEETGQMLQKDILCLPEENSELYKLYEENKDQLKYDFEELPSCSDYSLSSTESSGLWEFLFVKPLAFLILKLGNLIGNLGVSLILIGLAIRLILLPFTIKSSRQTFNMRKAQPEIEKIERKYRNRTDNESLMAKSQETMLVYKKYNINPVSGCLTSFIQLPLFFGFLEAINRVPAIFEGNLWGMHLGMTPMTALSQGNYIYVFLLLLIIGSTYASFKFSMQSQTANEAMNQMKMTMTFMIVIISIASLSLPTAIALYWVVNNVFAVVQNIVIAKINGRR